MSEEDQELIELKAPKGFVFATKADWGTQFRYDEGHIKVCKTLKIFLLDERSGMTQCRDCNDCRHYGADVNNPERRCPGRKDANLCGEYEVKI